MGKYDPLKGFLERQEAELVSVSFAELEALLGAKLPDSKRYPAWWSNNPWNNVMTKVWLDAGFVTEQVDVAAEKVAFRRKSAPARTELRNPVQRDGPCPGFGAMAGTIRMSETFDFTRPAERRWDSGEP